MVGQPEDGRIKLLVTRALLRARRERPRSFAGASYRPLEVAGRRARHVVAFARGEGARQVVAIAPRFVLALAGNGAPPVGHEIWGDTRVRTEGTSVRRWRCLITGRVVESKGGALELGHVLDSLPVTLLAPEESPW
jgi:(1->4)-alpha-D-glucan 1-alpha-D-glucosylmutase